MNSSDHPRAQLSAYLDGALGEPERVAVEGHLGSCADCRLRLGELRATASLIRSLPDPVPSRRLVPRVAAPPAWLAPLRTLTTLASGVSVFLFLATALLANVGGLASSAGTAAAPAASAAPAAPAVGGTGNAPAPTQRSAFGPVGATSPTALSAADAAKQATAAASANAEFATSSGAPADAVAARSDTARQARALRETPAWQSPWLWLALAIVTAVIALGLQRRLRKVN
ncbi:MAG TPA: zf-HC2 domain-containing protein [Methylomirabilota bacterium]|nr:zf-HC2 domain-containing protein [Methylomirabilota bacterium]